MKEVYLTQEGLEELKQRLDYLIVYLREDVAKKLQHARELGDLSENAEYDAAKQEESQVASEIKELEEQGLAKENARREPAYVIKLAHWGIVFDICKELGLCEE